MPTVPTSLSELDAVNVMLSVIGEAPVSTLEDETVSDVALARTILTNTLKETLEVGWHCNIDTEWTLTPDINGDINLPLNTARVDIDPDYQYRYPDVVQRGSRLYDRDDRTYTFTEPIKVRIIWYLDFDEVTPALKRYVTIRAARIFQDRTVGSSELKGFSERDELEAKMLLMESEADEADFNIFNEYTTARMLRRRLG